MAEEGFFLKTQRWLRKPCVGLLILGLISLGACTPAPLPSRAGTQVIAFGDSLVKGKGGSPGKDWVSRLSQQLGINILNKGRNGETTRSALSRLEEDVLNQDPRVVILLLGGNDALRRLPKKETFDNLAQIIDRIQQVGAAVLLVGVRGGFLLDPYEGQFEVLAQEKRTFYVSDIMQGIWGNRELLADTVHPNDQGYQRMADRLAPMLTTALEH